MSRIGKKPIIVPADVTVSFEEGNVMNVKGPKGELSQKFPAAMALKLDAGVLTVERPSDSKEHKALHGLSRSLASNMVVGCHEGFKKVLEINGVGYKAAMEGGKLVLNVGYSHPVDFEVPAGITIEVPNPNQIIVSGADKQVVGQLASEIRGKRPPEPYLGKGIKYSDEKIRRKAGKAGK
ncbi:MAG: 50S ribosomal protein L6 [Clostridia bacterium]|nr:50S ribosomal protein L6 [Clostridia bacterium]